MNMGISESAGFTFYATKGDDKPVFIHSHTLAQHHQDVERYRRRGWEVRVPNNGGAVLEPLWREKDQNPVQGFRSRRAG